MSKQKTTIRTPIVAVMGHVDHGKTTLLDTIRGTKVAASEQGGITQNTRAHQIVTKSGNKITFIDTPGHEAFSAMRSRGAEVTDFVLLVVAADDGVQAQTKESIKFAHDTETPIIVAVNKTDMPGANPERVKRELASFGVNIEEYGGDVMLFPVSALKNEGIDALLEGIELLAEINGLTAHEPQAPASAQAYVLESARDKRLGALALCIMQAGSITTKSYGVMDKGYFKTRALLDQNQRPITEVNEADPFWVTGLEQTAATGAIIHFTTDEKVAKTIAETLAEQVQQAVDTTPASAAGAEIDPNNVLWQLLAQREAEKQGDEQKILNIIVKASTQGTLEAVRYELQKLGDEDKIINIIEASTGEVTESDIRRIKAAGGIVISFQNSLNAKVEKFARQEKVIVRNYEIIYEMIEELTGALEGLIEPEEVEVEIARARVKKVFTLTDGSTIAGCEVIKGIMLKGYPVYVERPQDSTDDEIAEIGRGKIRTLRYLKEEVREIKKGQECGILIEPQPEGMEEGDEIVAYKMERN